MFDSFRALAMELPRPFGASAAMLLALVGAGCAGVGANPDYSLAPGYEPSNAFREEATLPADIRRVAVLPCVTTGSGGDMEFARETLFPVFLAELGRSKLFEITPLDPEQVRRWTGRTDWSGEEKLPERLFDTLREATGADAVLLVRLTQYRAYEPLSLGWRVKLIQTDEPRLLWSVDEVFDAREMEVARAARKFAREHPEATTSTADPGGVLQSPRRFARYTANAILGTMPAR